MNGVKLLTLAVLVFFAVLDVQGQEMWAAGHVVTNAGDTIRGEILFSDWNVSPTRIEFRNQAGPKLYQATEVASFSINDPPKIFRSREISLDYYTTAVVTDVTAAKVKTEKLQRFIEVLLTSPLITLYECLDEKGKERFVVEKNGQLTVLRNVAFRVSKGASYYMVKREYYKEELKGLLYECPTLNTTRLKYENKYIIALLKEYHNYCKVDYKLDFEQENLKPTVSLGAFAGRHFPSNLSMGGASLYIGSKKKFGSIYTPKLFVV